MLQTSNEDISVNFGILDLIPSGNERTLKPEVFQFLNRHIYFKGNHFILINALLTKRLATKNQALRTFEKIRQIPLLTQFYHPDWTIETPEAFPGIFVIKNTKRQSFLIVEKTSELKIWILNHDAFVPFPFEFLPNLTIDLLIQNAFSKSFSMQNPLNLQQYFEVISEKSEFPVLEVHIPILLPLLKHLTTQMYRKSVSMNFLQNYTVLHSQVDLQTKQILLGHLLKEKIATQTINFSSLTFILALINGCKIKEDSFFQTDLESLSFLNAHFSALQIIKKPRNGNNFLGFSQLSKLNLSQFIERISELLMNRYCQARFQSLH